jgi:hypothetical protein
MIKSNDKAIKLAPGTFKVVVQLPSILDADQLVTYMDMADESAEFKAKHEFKAKVNEELIEKEKYFVDVNGSVFLIAIYLLEKRSVSKDKK